jgi:hypothetical protein
VNALRFADLTIVIGALDPGPVFDRANALGLPHHRDFGRDGLRKIRVRTGPV